MSDIAVELVRLVNRTFLCTNGSWCASDGVSVCGNCKRRPVILGLAQQAANYGAATLAEPTKAMTVAMLGAFRVYLDELTELLREKGFEVDFAEQQAALAQALAEVETAELPLPFPEVNA